jgi:hypothetical protein
VDVDGLGLNRKRTSVRDAETGMPAPTQVPECLANFKVDKCFDCAGATPLRPGRAACLVWTLGLDDWVLDDGYQGYVKKVCMLNMSVHQQLID